MATVGEAIRKAIESGDYVRAALICDFLRDRHGCSYQDCYETFQRVTGISLAAFDQLMYRADTEGV